MSVPTQSVQTRDLGAGQPDVLASNSPTGASVPGVSGHQGRRTCSARYSTAAKNRRQRIVEEILRTGMEAIGPIVRAGTDTVRRRSWRSATPSAARPRRARVPVSVAAACRRCRPSRAGNWPSPPPVAPMPSGSAGTALFDVEDVVANRVQRRLADAHRLGVAVHGQRHRDHPVVDETAERLRLAGLERRVAAELVARACRIGAAPPGGEIAARCRCPS